MKHELEPVNRSPAESTRPTFMVALTIQVAAPIVFASLLVGAIMLLQRFAAPVVQ